jgi:hypothetical protein
MSYKEAIKRLDGPRNYSNFVRTGIKMFHILANVPWISPIAYILPVSNNMKEEAYKFKVLGSKQYRERRAPGTEPNDLFSHLIAGNKNGQLVPPSSPKPVEKF